MRSGHTLRRKDRRIEEFEKLASSFEGILARKHGTDDASQIRKEAISEFEELLPHAPTYSGGPLNPFNKIGAAASQMIAIYRPMRSRGMPVEEVALLFYDHYDELHRKIPRSIRWLANKFIFSRASLMILKKLGREISDEDDPDGFIIRYEKGDGEECDWYLSADRCGMVRYMENQGCPELARYCNMLDYIQGCAFDMGVRFKNCLGTGDPVCVECMKSGRETEVPPLVAELLERRDEILPPQ